MSQKIRVIIVIVITIGMVIFVIAGYLLGLNKRKDLNNSSDAQIMHEEGILEKNKDRCSLEQAQDVIYRDQSEKMLKVSMDSYGQINTTNWKICQIDDINIRFKYPDFWKGVYWDGINVCDPKEQAEIHDLLTKSLIQFKEDLKNGIKGNGCPGMALTYRDSDLNSKGNIFFVIGNAFGSNCGIARGAYWGDAVSYITSAKYIRDTCVIDDKNNLCSVYQTSNDVLVSKALSYKSFDPNPRAMFVYKMRSPHKSYNSMILSSAMLPYNSKINDNIIQQIVESIKFL
jgi:hypothetical protein